MKYFNHVGTAKEIPKLERVTRPDGTRYYVTPEGNKYPSVTTVLSLHNREGIIEWRKRVGEAEANRISRAAAGRGTRLHNIVEKYINNEDCDIQNPFDLKNFLSIQPILENIDNVHCQEQQMFSNHLRMSGTVDCIGEYKGKLSVIDFKTSSKRKEKDHIHSYFMQCAAYAIMYEEMTGIPISRLVVIISVENDYPQVFFEKRDNWVKYLLLYRNEYERITVI